MHVIFNLTNNKVYYTYSPSDYDRMQIDSIMYKKCFNKISEQEWQEIINELNHYKLNEMIVHTESIQNTRIHNENESYCICDNEEMDIDN